MRILFFGTASISKIYLKELYKNNHEIFVVTMPDKPALRKQRLTSPAVKVYASENNISFIQFEKFTADVIETIRNFGPDAGIAVAYGKLIPKTVFDIPRYKAFNVHFSLLPKYRGAAPVQYALCKGEIETGVTSFYIEEGLDTGDIIVQEKLSINITDNAETLFNKLISLGVKVMNKTLDLFQTGNINAVSQTGKPSFAPTFKKEDGLIDWNKNVYEIRNQFRGLFIWPGLYSIVSKGKLKGKRIKFVDIEIFEEDFVNSECGTVFSIEKNKGFTVSCAVGKILVTKVQPENKPVMSAWAFIQGGQLGAGDEF
ncbi:methionyl-tRNA formyltransferase [Endomicrobiia bacterium]|nr:methionyl-tRNA formyltransferase [Endomicrobiia bacterium]